MAPIFEGQPPHNKAFFHAKNKAKIWVVGM